MKKSINAQKKIEPANLPKTMVSHVLELFRKKYTSGAVRQIGVSYSGFVDESYTLLSLFDDVEQIEKENRLQTAIDVVREQFGFLVIQKGTVLTEGSRNIERSKLIVRTIPSLNKDFILIKTTTGHINLKLKDILSIELVEEVLYESA